MPNGSAVCTGVVATAVILLQLVLGEDAPIFWIFFSMNVVFLLMSYIPMFPAFLQLRKHDGDRKRVYRAPFEGWVLDVMLTIPAIELVLAIIATIVPLNGSPDEMDKLPMLVGVVILTLVGEAVRIVSKRGRERDYPGIGRGVPSRFDEPTVEEA
jgi:amino acid transporter